VRHRESIERAIADWCEARTLAAALRALQDAQVPCGPINDAAAIAADPQVQSRKLFESVEGASMRLPRYAPLLSETPGRSDSLGPALGAHTREVLGQRLGLSAAQIDALVATQVAGQP
jgi:crotonobetainyl-CoA:carnitine CoA-transferase CaiB-like acyl-CoA transferase